MRASRVLLPAFGKPTSPTSASSFSDRCSPRSSPAVPGSQKSRVWRVQLSKRARPPPPSPPWGPPNGTYFSRRKLLLPSPPAPERTRIAASSMNVLSSLFIAKASKPSDRARDRLGDAGDDPAARAAVLHDAFGQRVQGVVPAHADAAAGVHARAHLPDEYGARQHALAREHLDPAPLRVTVAAVARAAPTLLVRHDASPRSS